MNLRPFRSALLLLAAMNAGACTPLPGSPVSENDASPSIPDHNAPDAENDGSPNVSDHNAPDLEDARNDVLNSADLPDMGSVCERSPERRPSVSVTLSDGTIEDCDTLPWRNIFSRTLTGVVRDDLQDPASRTRLTIGTCAAGCDVVIRTTGSIPFAVPAGAYVEATYYFEKPIVCTQVLRVSNLAEWNGQKNPVSDASSPYLIVSSGTISPAIHVGVADITVASIPADCVPVAQPPRPCGSGFLRSFALRFGHANAAPLALNQAEEAAWSLNGQSLMVRNHQSFDASECDNWFDWGFTIAAR